MTDAPATRGTRARRFRRGLALMGAVLMAGAPAVSAADREQPVLPVRVDGLLAARAFTLEDGYRHRFSADQPWVEAGWLLVLEVDPRVARPRQVAEPVLYVGEVTAERLNTGHRSGRLVVIVPQPVDLPASPIWFGTPELPERVDPERAHDERVLAEDAGIRPFEAEVVHAARTRGGAPLAVADLTALLREAGAWIVEYSAPDKQVGQRLRDREGGWTERRRPAP